LIDCRALGTEQVEVLKLIRQVVGRLGSDQLELSYLEGVFGDMYVNLIIPPRSLSVSAENLKGLPTEEKRKVVTVHTLKIPK
jgi:hypothetical protein